jgi:hypothetical protein
MAIISQGTFTQGATAAVIRLPLVSDVDFMHVYNITQMAAAPGAAVGVQYYWQRGFPNGAKIAYFKSNAAGATNLTQFLTTGGFTLIDSTNQQVGALNNGSTGISAITNATPPVVTVGSTLGMGPGSIVRLYNLAGVDQLGGLEFTVGYNTFSPTTFDLSYMSAPGVFTGLPANSAFRVVPFEPIFKPRVRYISSITAAGVNSVVVTTVTHGYQVGEKVTFKVPSIFGMVQMDTLEGTIIAVNTSVTVNSFTVDIDSSAFSAFVFPANGNQPFTPAQVIPNGQNTAFAANNDLNQLVNPTVNVGYIGIQLAAGAGNPGGAALDVMYWLAGKSDSVNTIVPVPLGL